MDGPQGLCHPKRSKRCGPFFCLISGHWDGARTARERQPWYSTSRQTSPTLSNPFTFLLASTDDRETSSAAFFPFLWPGGVAGYPFRGLLKPAMLRLALALPLKRVSGWKAFILWTAVMETYPRVLTGDNSLPLAACSSETDRTRDKSTFFRSPYN